MINSFGAYVPLSGQDQDAPPIYTDKFLVVCDGLGGDGSFRHRVNDNSLDLQKSAFLGSRKVSKICSDFISTNYESLLNANTLAASVNELKVYIKSELTQYYICNPKADDNKGGMVFPTTLVAAVFKELPTQIDVTVLWAGDSRLYLFDEQEGLQLLTRDDVIGEFDSCFGKDCRMSNCISQDNDFSINYAQYCLRKNSVLFACSDGCFDFLPSPIHFEWNVLACLFHSVDLSNSFSTMIKNIRAGDDCTVAGAVFGFQVNELKSAAKRRASAIAPLKKAFELAEQDNDIPDEVRKEIRKLNSDNKSLYQTIINEVKKLLVASFKEIVETKSDEMRDQQLLFVSNTLANLYEPYNDYINSAIESVKIYINNKRLKDEFNKCFADLKSLVSKAEKKRIFRDRIEQKSRRNNPFGFSLNNDFGLSNLFFGQKTNHQYYFNQKNEIQNDCLNQIRELIDLLHKIENDISAYTNSNIRAQLMVKMEAIVSSLQELEGVDLYLYSQIENDESITISDTELEQTLIPLISKEGINCYKGLLSDCDFDLLRTTLEDYLILRDSVESISVSELGSASHFTEDFEQFFLKKHLFSIIEVINNCIEIASLIPAISKYKENVQKLETIQSELNGRNEKQLSIWKEYRTKYELYKKCSIKFI